MHPGPKLIKNDTRKHFAGNESFIIIKLKLLKSLNYVFILQHCMHFKFTLNEIIFFYIHKLFKKKTLAKYLEFFKASA